MWEIKTVHIFKVMKIRGSQNSSKCLLVMETKIEDSDQISSMAVNFYQNHLGHSIRVPNKYGGQVISNP
jgi:hypothetical protein